MTAPIRRVLAVDWSGDRSAAARKIWLCEVAAGGRVVRLENGRTREAMAQHLVAEGRRSPDFVVGLDFAFSFPGGFLAKRGHREIDTVWQEVEREGEEWLAECPNPPFWGKPGKKMPRLGPALYRTTELRVARATGLRPFSVFQVGGAGAVGVGSLRGMPILRRLRAAGFSIWPFDPPRLPMVVEIWPRLFIGSVAKSKREIRRAHLDARYPWLAEDLAAMAEASDDAFDALASGIEMERRLDELGALRQADDPETLLEGAIWLGDDSE